MFKNNFKSKFKNYFKSKFKNNFKSKFRNKMWRDMALRNLRADSVVWLSHTSSV
jgi:hypothetical protein